MGTQLKGIARVSHAELAYRWGMSRSNVTRLEHQALQKLLIGLFRDPVIRDLYTATFEEEPPSDP